ncbi:hypothetical protein C5167_030393 [Papaver somniferum]|uniref:uncharacterized protein LOC113343467 n=1 Tax=Papaver somniferum TaxID=3469 RepID=UPI000E703975|nr:uncharacterized protein LOC113343467 [Papaver somniferum]RZC93273.1 hypothetical protein C5167_030393 [Papaver somniferum]
MVEVKDWEVSSDGTQDSEVNLQDSDEDELVSMSGSIPKLQIRKLKSKVRWNSEMKMAEVLEKKGRCWGTTGIVRNSNTYLSIEETVFMAELGALVLVNSDDSLLSLGDMYAMLTEQKSGCSWDSFKAYVHLKSLGYIVGRHAVQWTLKKDKQRGSTTCVGDSDGSNGTSITRSQAEFSITDGLRDIHISNEATPTFDVYLPNNKFKKSSPGEPDFVVYVTREDDPPSKEEIENLKTRSKGALMICQVESCRVSLFSFKKVETVVFLP